MDTNNKTDPVEALRCEDLFGSSRPFGCKCQSMAHRVLGDGCDECNPELAAEIKAENEAEDSAPWLPIASAKINNFRVLGWCPAWDTCIIVKWSPGRPAPHWTTDDGAVTSHAPTHWQFLPPPPLNTGTQTCRAPDFAKPNP